MFYINGSYLIDKTGLFSVSRLLDNLLDELFTYTFELFGRNIGICFYEECSDPFFDPKCSCPAVWIKADTGL